MHNPSAFYHMLNSDQLPMAPCPDLMGLNLEGEYCYMRNTMLTPVLWDQLWTHQLQLCRTPSASFTDSVLEFHLWSGTLLTDSLSLLLKGDPSLNLTLLYSPPHLIVHVFLHPPLVV